MPAPTPPPTETRPASEAETIAGLLSDMGVTLAVDLQNQRLFAEIGRTAVSGAVDVLRIATERFEGDARFREDMTQIVGTQGYYLADAPGVPQKCHTASPSEFLTMLASAGLDVRMIVKPTAAGLTGRLAYLAAPDRSLAFNAHLLMAVCGDRFAAEPAFAEEMRTVLEKAEATLTA